MPIISLISCIILMLVIRIFVPEALFVSTMLSFVTILTYFTIENSDIRMAKEMVERLNNKTIKTINNLEDKLQNSLSDLITFGYKKNYYGNRLKNNSKMMYN